MTGGSRNQVEFNEELSGFFAESGTLPGSVDIKFQGATDRDRPLNTRTTDPPFGVSICLLYLPTGFDYTHKVIHLHRRSEDTSSGPVYELSVASTSDDEFEDLKANARERGMLGETVGGREYGDY